MADYDLFNGDADGICALTQLRNAEPRDATLITGVKRDVSLIKRIEPEAGDRVTVLDISMDKNRADLERILDSGADVFYVDHHYPGDIPGSRHLKAIINESPDVCTSLLVNNHLDGAFLRWAIVGTFGDNMDKSAHGLARNAGLKEAEVESLKNLGIYINYNGYGAALEDLHFRPDELYRRVSRYADPLDFIRDDREDFEILQNGYREDMNAAANVTPETDTGDTAVFLLPDAPWARRVSGVYSNDLANNHPDRAHAIVTERPDGTYLVSVRAPLNNKKGASELCRQFPTGGGREAAAGINELPGDQLQRFIETFTRFYGAG
jgi:single-stranded DNA-specific DHH superfamily exonuclease